MTDRITLTIEQNELCNKLKSMHLSAMANSLEEVFGNPNSDLLPFKDKIQHIVESEWEQRYSKKLNRFIKNATLKYPTADIDETIYEADRQLNVRIIEELSKCEWIDHGKNLVITGKSGSGKSYLSNALCICALRQFKSVRYIKASQLVNDLAKAEKLDNYQEELHKYASYNLLVIDDFGLMILDVNKCRNLFEVIDSRDPYKSTMVISQFPVSSWYDIFQDHTYAEACLARMLADAYRLEMNGKNMRNLDPINSNG